MNRRNKINLFNDDRDTKKILMISFFVLIIAVFAFVITFLIYRNYLHRQSEIAELKVLEIADLANNTETQSSEASSSIGKTVNEMQEIENTEIESEKSTNNEKIAINTSNMVKENSVSNEVASNTSSLTNENASNGITTSEKVTNEGKINEATTKTNAQRTKKEEKVPDPTFKKPVEGEITNEFAKDTLIYSNTLQEWVTHYGIDIKADKTTIVKASTDGTIKSIKNDPRYGITVTIEHANGFSSIYSNLLTAEFIKEGEKVEQGQTIGTVGNTATFEIADESHLHFEILKNGENVDPELYLK